MSVNGPGNIFAAGAELDGQYAFGNHIRCPGADNVDAEYPIGLFMSDHFDQTLRFTQTARPPHIMKLSGWRFMLNFVNLPRFRWRAMISTRESKVESPKSKVPGFTPETLGLRL